MQFANILMLPANWGMALLNIIFRDGRTMYTWIHSYHHGHFDHVNPRIVCIIVYMPVCHTSFIWNITWTLWIVRCWRRPFTSMSLKAPQAHNTLVQFSPAPLMIPTAKISSLITLVYVFSSCVALFAIQCLDNTTKRQSLYLTGKFVSF